MVHTKEDLTGKKYGYWEVLYQADDYISPQGIHYAKWHCKCTYDNCGNEKDVHMRELISGGSKSCGCYKKITSSQNGKNNTTHGKTNTRLYNIWHGIKDRCLNSNCKYFKNYGDRGITIFEDWALSFEAFYNWSIDNGYKDNLTIDRIDNNKGYYPDNCRWVDYKIQGNNRRNNRTFLINGVEMTLSECSDLCGFSETMLSRRMKINGLSIEEAMTIPKMTKGKKRGLKCD